MLFVLRRSRGYTIVELLLSVLLLTALLFAIGDAVVHVLRAQSIAGARADAGRTVEALAARLNEEARSSSAVYVPAIDVLGNPNSGPGGGHEVDFFRKLSAGGDAFVAYRFDQSTGIVTRFDYTRTAGRPSIVDSDVAASGIQSFQATRIAAGDSPFVVRPESVSPVRIYYGSDKPDAVGGNDIVAVSLAGRPPAGAAPHVLDVHLSTQAAPTNFAVVVPTGAPGTSPPVKVIPFVIMRHGIKPPHGPWHMGDPGNPESIHWIAAWGLSAWMVGPGTAGTWLDFFEFYPVATDGTYTLKASDGHTVTVSISCEGGCPTFAPKPISAPPITPPGGVVFQASE